MKKIIIAGLLALFSLTAQASEKSDIGVGIAWDYGFGVTAQINRKINLTLGNDGFGADLILIQKPLEAKSPLSWYVGAGAGVHSIFNSKKDSALSARVIGGIDWDINNQFDLFLALDPELRLYVGDNNKDQALHFGIDGIFGLRFFF